jgi:glutathione S-transferase
MTHRKSARERIGQSVSVAAAHLANRDYLVGDRFTVADAHLAWALLLLGHAGVDLAQWPSLTAYRDRIQARPRVKAAIGIEMQLFKTVKA